MREWLMESWTHFWKEISGLLIVAAVGLVRGWPGGIYRWVRGIANLPSEVMEIRNDIERGEAWRSAALRIVRHMTFELDRDGRLIRSSRSVEDVLGKFDDIEGFGWIQSFSAGDRERVRREVELAIKEAHGFNIEVLIKSKAKHVIDGSIVRLTRTGGVVGFIVDVRQLEG